MHNRAHKNDSWALDSVVLHSEVTDLAVEQVRHHPKVPVYVCMYVCLYVCMFVCIRPKYMYVCMYVCIFMYAQAQDLEYLYIVSSANFSSLLCIRRVCMSMGCSWTGRPGKGQGTMALWWRVRRKSCFHCYR